MVKFNLFVTVLNEKICLDIHFTLSLYHTVLYMSKQNSNVIPLDNFFCGKA
jgi:hypothetical protein